MDHGEHLCLSPPLLTSSLRRRALCSSAAVEDKPLIEAAEIARALTSNPDTLPQVFAHLPPATKKTLGLQWAMAELESEFAKADKDKDGALSYKEFALVGARADRGG